jgi:nucleotide-binding universal stress UspA family protein
MFRDLLVHVDGSDAGRRRVKFAADLAERTQSRLSGLHVTPPAEVPVQFKPSLVDRVEGEIAERLDARAHMSAAIFREEVGLRASETAWSEISGDVVDGVCDRAGYADLVILGQYERQGHPENHPLPIAHSVISRCGRPVLVVPGSSSACALDRVAVVWDRSREAIRTIHDALPLLGLSRTVQIVMVAAPSDAGADRDADSLRLHLAHHGVEIEDEVAQIPEYAQLPRRIATGGYDLLVIGGSSSPAWVDFLFGDVTQDILLSSAIPIFVSH